MSWLGAISVRRKLHGCASVGEGTRAHGTVWVHGGGSVRLGARVHLDGTRAPIELHAGPGAELVLDDDVHVAGGTSIEAQHAVHIGARTRVGPFCKVLDTHYHRLEGDRTERPPPGLVVVEEDVELGPRTVLLPRAHVGRGSTVRAGTVVTRRFPPDSVLSGIPAAAHARPPAGRGDGAKRDTDKRPSDAAPPAGEPPPAVIQEALRIARLLVTDPLAGMGRIERGLGVARAQWVFRKCRVGALVNVLGDLRVQARGEITLGDRIQFVQGMVSSEIVCDDGAEIRIGTGTMFSYGLSIHALRSVRIGERCLFGAMVQIRDADHEGIAPVVIGDDVWVAHGAMIEPGVTIGAGSVISAGSVVTSDVPSHSIAVGNPASCIPLRMMTRREAAPLGRTSASGAG